MDVDARVEAVKRENERLRARVAELEAQLGMDFVAPVEWRLTPAESRIFGTLLKRDLMTKDAAMATLYGLRPDGGAEPKIVDVFICKIRRKLTPFGIEIATRWGHGYSLTAAGRTAAKAAIAQRESEAA